MSVLTQAVTGINFRKFNNALSDAEVICDRMKWNVIVNGGW
jgi:hypothetical protein